MRSQGLPINFIVLIAIGITVLVLILMFVLPTFTSGQAATTQTKATGECNARCAVETQYAAASGGTSSVDGFPRTNSPYCNLIQTVPGIGQNLRCDALIPCTVEDKDGDTCKLTCSGSTAQCI